MNESTDRSRVIYRWRCTRARNCNSARAGSELPSSTFRLVGLWDRASMRPTTEPGLRMLSGPAALLGSSRAPWVRRILRPGA